MSPADHRLDDRGDAPPPEVLSLVAELVATTGSRDVAFLADGSRFLFARGEDPGSPFTATTTLIQGIHAREPARARQILRARIWTTREPGPFAHGMVKVAARRLTVVAPTASGPPPPFALEEIRFEPGPAPATREVARGEASHSAWLKVAGSLVADRPADRPRHELDRAVGAVLVSTAGEPLAARANTNAGNRTLHAELNVLTDAWLAGRGAIPPGSRLYATLEPCKMCAGLAWELGVREVYFAERDPGPAARDSILDRRSNARRRYARTASEREAECLFQVTG